jgi:putative membrane protein
MEDNKKILGASFGEEPKGAKGFFRDILAGVCIGIAFIIPGFSVGSAAAILGVYERLIKGIAGIFKEFKKSIATLFPIALGLIIGICTLLFPIIYFLDKFPLPTVSLFVGLAIGGIPTMARRVKGKANSTDIMILLSTLIGVVFLSLIPGATEVNLIGLDLGGYLLLFLIGMVGACALVIPGISGSMLLLILGYYRPLVRLVTDHLLRLNNVGISILVLGVCGLGMVVGFFLISVIMKILLEKYHRGTYFAIIGFIIGSLPTVYISTMKNVGMLSDSFAIISMPSSAAYYVACIFLLLMGVSASSTFATISDKKID